MRLFSGGALATHSAAIQADPFDTSLVYVIDPIQDDDGSLELSSLGLRALGLHEMRMEDIPEDQLEGLASMLNGLAQIAWEQGPLQDSTPVSPQAVANPTIRSLLQGIEGAAAVSYMAPREGEPDNPVVLVAFEGTLGEPVAPVQQQVQVEAVSAEPASGAAASTTPASDPNPETATPLPAASPAAPQVPVEPPPAAPTSLEEALALSAKALTGPVRDQFNAGLPSGDILYVKAPFHANDGSIEYLWIQVTTWQGDTLTGVLRSQPTWATGVTNGDEVSVAKQAIFDYLLRRADGSSEGNLTESFLH